MNAIKSIRASLEMTQAELARVLDMTQANVAFYERGQTVPPDVARRLILFARSRGFTLGYEDVYGSLGGVAVQEVAHG
jgi:putative transcriptional regulator